MTIDWEIDNFNAPTGPSFCQVCSSRRFQFHTFLRCAHHTLIRTNSICVYSTPNRASWCDASTGRCWNYVLHCLTCFPKIEDPTSRPSLRSGAYAWLRCMSPYALIENYTSRPDGDCAPFSITNVDLMNAICYHRGFDDEKTTGDYILILSSC